MREREKKEEREREREKKGIEKTLFDVFGCCVLFFQPENMLCTTKGDDFDIIISDFGLAKKLAPGMEITTPCGTSGYVGITQKKEEKR